MSLAQDSQLLQAGQSDGSEAKNETAKVGSSAELRTESGTEWVCRVHRHTSPLKMSCVGFRVWLCKSRDVFGRGRGAGSELRSLALARRFSNCLRVKVLYSSFYPPKHFFLSFLSFLFLCLPSSVCTISLLFSTNLSGCPSEVTQLNLILVQI